MRLIDADNFRRFAHEQLEGNKTYSIDEILEMIDEQPTAYDVENVVEEIEKESVSIWDDDLETNIRVVDKRVAMQAIRKGGVE